ncbi:uncharacterized protein SOCE26_056340 [Sorangium cellulosum]|uniref:Secreted protein n=1 Tax=Sorangium cellulosum TaxID=56 RepID=A0A2L0EXY3_SORCE|nr:hypothetical protein [Sorangium cellulosum]AUX44171.1 uncharacterized protein SOCE26_056340 [Sorangium cellulosum]
MTKWMDSAPLRRPIALLAALVALAGPAAVGCAPEPENLPCSSDSACRRLDDDLTYCVNSRCVECLSSAICGAGNQCVDGRCMLRCRDARDCRSGQLCREGACEDR